MARLGPTATTDLDGALALIATEQARPERRCTYVGVEPEGIRAELDALRPPWADTLRVVTDGDRVVGASVVEWDEELGRCWILGPWVAGDAAAWDDAAPALLDAALAQLPASVRRREVCGEVANELLADLVIERGWAPTEVNHALEIDEATVAAWPDDLPTIPIRDAVPDDLAAIAELHDAEFPATYATAAQLVGGEHDRIVLVVPAGPEEPHPIAGYAAGNVHADGEGFIDFVVVHPDARGGGVGRRLVTALTRELLAASTTATVALTVQDHRGPARSLYEQLGFRTGSSFVAYRSGEA